MSNDLTANSIKATDLQVGERQSNYRVVALDGTPSVLFKSEVEAVMNWDVEDATFLGGKDRFTHMERFNSRTGQWKTVVAWDDRFAVTVSDAETAHHLASV